MSGGADAAAVPGSMRAWQVVRHGAPSEALERRDVAVPQPAAGELLVEVDACALNFPDVLLAAGQYQVRPELPFTPGIELAGRVAAVGDSVDGFAVSDRVIGMPQLPHGALADYARERLARYKVPRRIEFVDLPKTSTGKIQKNVLRETARQRSGDQAV